MLTALISPSLTLPVLFSRSLLSQKIIGGTLEPIYVIVSAEQCLSSQAKKGEPEDTPNEILSMVKSLASPPHRLLLFLQQSSVEWCSSLWLDAVREIDPTFKRTIIVISKFDNRLKVYLT